MYNLHPGLILILTGVVTLFLPYQKLRSGAALAGAVLALSAMIFMGDGGLTYDFTSAIQFQLLAVDSLSRAFGLIFCSYRGYRRNLFTGHGVQVRKVRVSALCRKQPLRGLCRRLDLPGLLLGADGCILLVSGVGWRHPPGKEGILPLSGHALFRRKPAAGGSGLALHDPGRL